MHAARCWDCPLRWLQRCTCAPAVLCLLHACMLPGYCLWYRAMSPARRLLLPLPSACRQLSSLQFAKAAVYSYPWFPDPISFCSLLAGFRAQQPLALPLQQQAAAAGLRAVGMHHLQAAPAPAAVAGW